MCGIAGIIHRQEISSRQIEAARNSLRTRGPDGSGSALFSFSQEQGWHHSTQGTAALIQTRLSIRDVSSAAAQPMKNEDGSVWIVYNGEIYGWEQEAHELRQRGHQFASHSDTEFILHGYEQWGDAVLEHLRGMFAFAIIDFKKQRLFLARDRLGEKPLFYTATNGAFAFASTAHALSVLVSPDTVPRLNPRALDAFLTHRYIPAPLSIIENFYKLPPAHSLVVPLEGGEPILSTPQEYWTPQAAPEADPTSLFEESVRLRLVSDRPLGLFLSGGIDSQAIAASIAHRGMMPQLSTFTAGFPDNASYDESLLAAEIARRFNLHHTSLPIMMKDHDAERIVHDLDEPFADPSAIPTWYLCKAATEKIVVALAGDGGDELFAGYKRYNVHQRASHFLPRHGWKLPYWSDSSLCLKTSRKGRLRRALLGYQLGWEEAYALRFSAFDPLSRAFLQPDFPIQSSYWRKPAGTLAPRDWMLECDRLNYLPEYILRKSDLCGMAHGLELRSPMLDHRFFEAVQGMSTAQRFSTPPKQFLLNQIGPQAVLGPKRGFNPPLHAWLHQEILSSLCQELPRTLNVLTHGQLSKKNVATFLALARNDARLDELTWQLVVLALSLQQFVAH